MTRTPKMMLVSQGPKILTMIKTREGQGENSGAGQKALLDII
jgi:hypothetical protein